MIQTLGMCDLLGKNTGVYYIIFLLFYIVTDFELEFDIYINFLSFHNSVYRKYRFVYTFLYQLHNITEKIIQISTTGLR